MAEQQMLVLNFQLALSLLKLAKLLARSRRLSWGAAAGLSRPPHSHAKRQQPAFSVEVFLQQFLAVGATVAVASAAAGLLLQCYCLPRLLLVPLSPASWLALLLLSDF
jgi:hypothetical protein